MLIRVRGYTAGIKEYLEDGQKKGRDMERDEMDERVVLAGDLQLTNDIIESIDTDAERYLSITMSFKEDYVGREVLEQIVADFRDFAFSAYEPDEYVFYAEAHLARIKSYANRKTGEFVERKPHIHIVIPTANLLSGTRLDPFGLVMNQERYLRAFQEHINHKYGLASPQENRRVEFTDASEMISRYKGDVFEGANNEAKARLLAAVMDRGITNYDDFKTMLREFGETRTRNAGRSGEYENVRLPDAPRGINLKEYVFSRAFIELSAEQKQAAVTEKYLPRYEETGAPRPTPEHMLAALQQWHDVGAKEVKYLNGAFRAKYRAASPEEQRYMLSERERNFYQRYDSEEPDGRTEREPAERMGQRDGGWRRGDSHAGRSTAGREPQSQIQGQDEPQHDPQWHPEHDFGADRPWPSPQSGDRLRSLSGIAVDGWPTRTEMLLPDHARYQLDQQRSAGADALRRNSTGRGTEQRGRIGFDWRYALAAEYDAYTNATEAEQRAMHAAGAARLQRNYDGLKGGGSLPADFGGPGTPRQLSRIPSLAKTPLLHTGAPAPRRGRAHMSSAHADRLSSQYDRSKTGTRLARGRAAVDGPRRLAAVGLEPEARQLASAPSRRRPPRPRNTATGREADSLLSQLARDREEVVRSRHGTQRTEFQEIRHELDATRLLAALAHSHGVLPEKYQVTRGRDGADRIKVGGRHLNVSDFLTKELNLSWNDASQILRDTYREQIGNDPEHLARQTPQQHLWREYQDYRRVQLTSFREQWIAQGENERRRKAQIREVYIKQRSSIQDNPSLKPGQKKAEMSLARMARIERDAALRDTIAIERAQLKERSSMRLDDHYRAFLTERAQTGDERALFELRRLQRTSRPAPETPAPIISPAKKDQQQNAIIYHGSVIRHTVHANGDVTYTENGRAILDDEGRSLRMWESEAEAIELGLRLATAKFGSTLDLSGPDDFRHAAARVAAEANLYVQFTDDSLNVLMRERRAELLVERAAERDRQRAREQAIRQIAREALSSAPEQPEQQPDDQEKGPAPDMDAER
jgi:hypothetical protein